MTFDLILNLAWALMGLAVWVSLITRARARGWHRRLTVLLAIVALFPCISASDDLVSLRNLTIPSRESTVTLSMPGGWSSLPRMLETIETSQVAAAFVLLLMLISSGILGTLLIQEVSRQELVLAGRSPPLFL